MKDLLKFYILLFIIITCFFIWPVFCLGEEKPLLITQVQIAGEENKEKDEFVELYNPNDFEVDLTDWYIQRKTEGASDYSTFAPKKLFSGKIIKIKGYFLIARQDSSFVNLADATTSYPLTENNSLVLKNPNREIVDKVGFGQAQDFETSPAENPPPGKSINRKWDEETQTYQDTDNNANDFEINPNPQPKNSSYQPSSEEEALPEEEPSPPPAGAGPAVVAQAGPDVFALAGQEIQFSAAGSYNNIGCLMSYFWNFGDGTTSDEKITAHTYQFTGQYIVILTISCDQSSDTDTLIANIYGKDLFINEFLPNTTNDSDKSTWIELYNSSEQIVDLTNWQLATKENSQTFVFPAGSLIAPKQFLVLIEPATKLNFSPSKDSLQLIYPNGVVAQKIEYEEAKAGWSVNRVSDESYVWSATPTPGLINLITALSLAEQEPLQLNELTKINQATIFQPEPSPVPSAQNVPVIVQKPATEKTSPLSETPKEPEQELFSQGVEPTSTSAPIEQTLLAGMSTHQLPKSKTAKFILSISVVLSFALLAGWGMLMMKKTLRR